MMLWQRWNAWTLDELPRLNREILAGRLDPGALETALAGTELDTLPRPETLSPEDARRLVVLLGLAGACVARHYQEADTARKATPQDSFRRLRAGPDAAAFLDYFSALAAATGVGHPGRDSYASLVRWNLPETVVEMDGHTVAALPGGFPDGRLRTYTADPGEIAFFELLKKSEALELAVNDLLEPVADGRLDVLSRPAAERALAASRLMTALIGVNLDFAERGPERGGLRTEHFLDVFRQFAVHWRIGDVPPSGAQDPEFLRRDLLLGIAFDGYHRHLRRVFPGLLAAERARLAACMDRPPVQELLLRALNLDTAALARLSPDQLRALLAEQPALAAWYLLLAANGKFGGVHLRLTEKYLFKPQRARDEAGLGDRELVSNRRGTTGMEEPLLVRLARARRDHALRPLGTLPTRELAALCGDAADTAARPLPTVRFAPTCG